MLLFRWKITKNCLFLGVVSQVLLKFFVNIISNEDCESWLSADLAAHTCAFVTFDSLKNTQTQLPWADICILLWFCLFPEFRTLKNQVIMHLIRLFTHCGTLENAYINASLCKWKFVYFQNLSARNFWSLMWTLFQMKIVEVGWEEMSAAKGYYQLRFALNNQIVHYILRFFFGFSNFSSLFQKILFFTKSHKPKQFWSTLEAIL